MRSLRLSLLAVGLLGLTLGGCLKRRQEVDPLDALLAAVDRAWERRGTDGLEPVGVALEAAWEMRRDAPGVRWREARYHVALGLVEQDDAQALRHFARARSHSLFCLDGVSGFGTLRRAGRWTEALSRVEAERAPCASWGGVAWVRWRLSMREAGALDDPAIQGFLAGMPADDLRLDLWARATAASIYDLQSAEIAYRDAIEAAPEDFVRRADRLILVTSRERPAQAQVRAQTVLQMTPHTPEERAAYERLDRILGGPVRL